VLGEPVLPYQQVTGTPPTLPKCEPDRIIVLPPVVGIAANAADVSDARRSDTTGAAYADENKLDAEDRLATVTVQRNPSPTPANVVHAIWVCATTTEHREAFRANTWPVDPPE
jgi:hypothetical protein